MKRLCLLLSIMISSLGCFAQSKSPKEKISEVYGTYWNEIVSQDNQRESVIIDLLENRVDITEVPYEEGEKYILLSSVPLFNKYNNELKRDDKFVLESFNILKYDIPFFSSLYQMYRIDGTNYVIIIKPQNR